MTETTVVMITMVQAQVVEVATNRAQLAIINRTATVPILGGSPLVQGNNLETQPQEETMLVQSLSTAPAPTPRLTLGPNLTLSPNLALTLDLVLTLNLTLNLSLTLVLHLHHTHNADLLRDPKPITIL